MAYPIKFIASTMRGAPVLSGTAGALIGVLDACKDGFGQVTATSVTVSGGIATANLPAASSFDPYTIVLVAGATPGALNGEQRVLLGATSSSISWATAAPDGVATGTITIKVAPIGLTKLFSGTNLAAYKFTDITATGCVLRVDDTGTTAARVRGYESMTDISTGSGLFPTDIQQSGGGYWPKSSVASATAIPWAIIASPTGLHYINAFYFGGGASSLGQSGWWFGDIKSRKAGDGYNCALIASTSANDTFGTVSCRSAANGGSWLARSYSQIGGSANFGKMSPVLSTSISLDNTFSGFDALCGVYPNGPDGALVLSPVQILEGATIASQVWRGTLPGVYHSPQQILAQAFSQGQIVEGTVDLAGHMLYAAMGRASTSPLSSLNGATFYDITGPW